MTRVSLLLYLNLSIFTLLLMYHLIILLPHLIHENEQHYMTELEHLPDSPEKEKEKTCVLSLE